MVGLVEKRHGDVFAWKVDPRRISVLRKLLCILAFGNDGAACADGPCARRFADRNSVGHGGLLSGLVTLGSGV